MGRRNGTAKPRNARRAKNRLLLAQFQQFPWAHRATSCLVPPEQQGSWGPAMGRHWLGWLGCLGWLGWLVTIVSIVVTTSNGQIGYYMILPVVGNQPWLSTILDWFLRWFVIWSVLRSNGRPVASILVSYENHYSA